MFPTTLLNTMLFLRLANSLLVDKYNIDAQLYARYLCLREILNILALKYVAISTKMQ